MKTRRWGLMALAVALALTMLWGCQALIKPEEPEARSYNTPCYQEQGGVRWVCGDGGELAVLAGGTLDVAGSADFTGATVTGFSPSTIDSNVTVTGNLVVSGSTTSVGTITGDVTGNLTGDVTGNVTGDVTGTLTGDVTGDLTGDVMDADYVTTTSLYVSAGSDFDGAMNVDANGDFDSLSTLSIDSDEFWDSTGSVMINDDAEITGTLDVGGALTVTGEIVFGADQLNVLGIGLPGYQVGFGRIVVTGTVTATHATGVPSAGFCTLDTISTTTALCGVQASATVVTLTVYTIDATTVATLPATINWLLFGIPSP